MQLSPPHDKSNTIAKDLELYTDMENNLFQNVKKVDFINKV